MKNAFKLLGIFLAMAAFGALMPHLPGSDLSAAEDCGIGCSPSDPCEELPRDLYFFACCNGYCSGLPGDDPVWHCFGRCQSSGALCDCEQAGCHDFCT